MTFLAAFLIVLCAIVVWNIRKPLYEAADEPTHLAWSSPVDDSYFETVLPDGCDPLDVWETLAWIGGLPEVGQRV